MRVVRSRIWYPGWLRCNSASSAANITSDSVGAECKCTTSVTWSRRTSVRSIDITGVIPEPPVMNNTDGGAGSGSTKLPCGAASRTIVPGATPPTRCVDRNPSGMALTVIVMVRLDPPIAGRAAPALMGLEVNEYDRQRQRPSTNRPMPTYWPGW